MSLDITPAEALLVSPDSPESDGVPIGISDRTLWIMAAACGASAANIYYNQPLLGDIARYFHSTPAQAGMVFTASQIGYVWYRRCRRRDGGSFGREIVR